jgi:putative transposase
MNPNEFGSIVQSMWRELPDRYPNVIMDDFIVRPNHIHGIIVISDVYGVMGAGSPRPNGPTISRPWNNIPPRPNIPPSPPTGVTAPRPCDQRFPQPGQSITPCLPVVDSSPGFDSMNMPTLGQIAAFHKYQSTIRINQIRGASSAPVWQRNYYEHIIRIEEEWSRIRKYIRNNPSRWEMEKENE